VGSPPDEADRQSEPIVHRRIGLVVAVATTPVTLAQFRRFLNERHRGRTPIRKYCPEPDCPVIGVNWFMAAEYCRMVEREGGKVLQDPDVLPPSEDIRRR